MKLLLHLLLVLMMGSAYAQNNLPACQGSDSSRWTNCFGVLKTIGGIYEGEFIDGKRHGKGTETYSSGSQYFGEWKSGAYSGHGSFFGSNGNLVHKGIWVDNQLISAGNWHRSPTKTIDLTMESKKPTDLSELKKLMKNLAVCEGFVDTWNDCYGGIDRGNGNTYDGNFTNGKPNGIGLFVYAGGNKYLGEHKFDKLHGQGVYTFSNGDKYVGQWKDGTRDGRGIFFGPKGEIIYQGLWAQDTLIKPMANQQLINPTNKVEKLYIEADDAKRKQTELEQQLRLSQNQSPAPPVLSTPTPATTPSMGKRLALVIGNQAYNVRPLLNPRNDADDMSRALKNAGFEVIDVRDASLAQMRNGVRQFGDRLLTRDVGLVYYSGHGIEVRGRNYFIPVNADIKRSDEIADQSLDVNLILEKMETAKKGVNILIVDACRDDPFGRSFRSSSRGLANMDAPQGTIIAFATSPGKVAADGEGRNSPYTKNLIKTMQIPNLPIEQVFKQVRRAVQQETKNQQTPWENTSLSGDFYFSVKK